MSAPGRSRVRRLSPVIEGCSQLRRLLTAEHSDSPVTIYATVTYEIKLFQNFFGLRRHPTEIILFQRVETCLKLFQNHFTGLLQLMNIFQCVQCR